MSEAKSKDGGTATQDGPSRAGKYLTFVLEPEEYGVEILKVREILGMMPITSVPQTPHHVKGVINLRGKVIPVTDLRLKFGLMEIEYTKETCVIVVEVGGVQMGIIVDTVREVVDIEENQIEDAPSFGSAVNTDFILGMGKVGERVKMLLDIEKVLSAEEMSMMAGMASMGGGSVPATEGKKPEEVIPFD